MKSSEVWKVIVGVVIVLIILDALGAFGNLGIVPPGQRNMLLYMLSRLAHL